MFQDVSGYNNDDDDVAFVPFFVVGFRWPLTDVNNSNRQTLIERLTDLEMSRHTRKWKNNSSKIKKIRILPTLKRQF